MRILKFGTKTKFIYIVGDATKEGAYVAKKYI